MKTLFRLLSAVLVAVVASFSIASALPVQGDSSDILGTNPSFLYGTFVDAYGNQFKTVVDSTPTTPAALGKIVYFTGSTWIQAATANLAVPTGFYGVVVNPALVSGGNAVIQVKGLVNTSVKTGATTACTTTGDVPLAITATGDLSPTTAATTPGVTWGFCVQALAVSQPATLILAVIGGY